MTGLGSQSVAFGSENQTTETKLDRTKKERMINLRLPFCNNSVTESPQCILI